MRRVKLNVMRNVWLQARPGNYCKTVVTVLLMDGIHPREKYDAQIIPS
jgi:hypothetical protein